jgi:hypothetical protein
MGQTNWRFCQKCNAMFFNGYQGGVCSAGGKHLAQGFDFNLPYGPPASPPVMDADSKAQEGWRFCLKCNVMFLGQPGKCAAGSGHTAQGLLFILPHDVPVTANKQNNWRFCGTCHALFFAGYAGGKCVDGGPHSPQGFNFVLAYGQSLPDVKSAFTLVIGINPSSTTKMDEVDSTGNPGHVMVAFRDASGKFIQVFSYGPAQSAARQLGCSGPGKTGYHLLASDDFKLYEFPITAEQYQKAGTKIKEIDAAPGLYSGTHQCTTTAIEVVSAAGVDSPGGKGTIYIPLCPNAENVSAPAFLDRELEAQFKKAGKPIVTVKGSYFRGLVDVEN